MLEITFLGTGTSQGVPLIACNCEVCSSSDSKDKRLRSSLFFTFDGKNYVIDTGPDFRQQMLREKVQHLEAVIFTHEHKDHIAGLDDVRAFNFKEKKSMELYCSDNVEIALRREFHYALYPIGTFYKRHLDTFQNDDSRKLSIVCYLNDEDWLPEYGGELVIYKEGEEDINIYPLRGRMVVFESQVLEHEVKPVKQERLSITGWLKTRKL